MYSGQRRKEFGPSSTRERSSYYCTIRIRQMNHLPYLPLLSPFSESPLQAGGALGASFSIALVIWASTGLQPWRGHVRYGWFFDGSTTELKENGSELSLNILCQSWVPLVPSVRSACAFSRSCPALSLYGP